MLRFGAPTWPLPPEVHSERADRRVQHLRADLLQRHDRAVPGSRQGQQGGRGQGLAAWSRLLLGSVFLGVKMYEYNAKFSHGIYPHEAAQPDLRKGRSATTRPRSACGWRRWKRSFKAEEASLEDQLKRPSHGRQGSAQLKEVRDKLAVVSASRRATSPMPKSRAATTPSAVAQHCARWTSSGRPHHARCRTSTASTKSTA